MVFGQSGIPNLEMCHRNFTIHKSVLYKMNCKLICYYTWTLKYCNFLCGHNDLIFILNNEKCCWGTIDIII